MTSPTTTRIRSSAGAGTSVDRLLADLRPAELVRTYRSGIHENSHYGSLVILDRDGSVLFQCGDVAPPGVPSVLRQALSGDRDAGVER